MEARRLKLTLSPPHVNHSNHRFCVKYPEGNAILYMGLSQVRDITRNTINTIINKRPFQNLEDFLLQVNPQKKEAQNLILCGALDGLTSIPSGLDRISFTQPPGQMQLFSDTEKQVTWNQQQRLKAQRDILGVSLSISPLEAFSEEIQSAGAITTLEARIKVGETVWVAGMRQTLRRFRNKSNQMIGYLMLEDLEGSLRVLIPPLLYKRHYLALRTQDTFLIKGTMESDPNHDRIQLVADEITVLHIS